MSKTMQIVEDAIHQGSEGRGEVDFSLDNPILCDLHNFSHHMKVEFNNYFSFIQKYF